MAAVFVIFLIVGLFSAVIAYSFQMVSTPGHSGILAGQSSWDFSSKHTFFTNK
jgi:hypothetical protein